MDNDTANGLSNDSPNKQQASLEKKREGGREEGREGEKRKREGREEGERRERYVFYSKASCNYHQMKISKVYNLCHM